MASKAEVKEIIKDAFIRIINNPQSEEIEEYIATKLDTLADRLADAMLLASED